MSAGRRLMIALALVSAITVAACGSTVPVRERQLASRAANDLGEPGLATDSTAVDAGTVASAGGALATATTRASTSRATTPRVASAAGSATSPVKLGFIYSETAGVFFAALGLSGSVADGRTYANALLKYVNAHGGLGGHPVSPVYYNINLTRTDPYAVWMQEMCSLWTQDNHVIAGQVLANSDFSLVADCLGKQGALFDNVSAWVRTAADYRKFPYWVEPSMLTGERLAEEYVNVPKQLGYFGAKPKIGLLVYDYAQSTQMAQRLTDALRRSGYAAPTTFTVHMGESTPELATTLSQVQAAVLRFRSEGVDHVMSVAYPGAVAFFMKYADSQGYTPRYALTTYEGLVAVKANAPTTQLKDAVAVGWLPNADVDAAHRPPLNATGQLCMKIFTDGGVAPAEQSGGFGYCQWVLMLQAAASKVTGTFDGRALINAVHGLGTSYVGPATFATTLSAQRHDGVAAVRPVRFDGGCTCWVYAGPNRSVP